MKLKNTAWIALGISILGVLVSLYLNFDLVPKIQYYSDSNETAMLAIESEAFLIDYTLDLQNIDESILLSPEIEATNYNRLQAMNQAAELLQTNGVEMNQISLNRHNESITKMNDHLNKFKNDLNALITNPKQIDKEDTQVLFNSIATIRSDLDKLNIKIFDDVQTLLNIAFGFILVIIGLMVVALVRFVYITIPTVNHSLQVLFNSNLKEHRLPKFNPIFNEERTIKHALEKEYKEKVFSTNIHETLFDLYTVEDAMDVLFNLLNQEMGVDRIGLAFVDYQKKEFIAEYSVINQGDIYLGPGFVQSFDHTSLTSMLTDKKPRITKDLSALYKQKPTSQSLMLLQKEKIQSNLIIPMIINDTVFGILFLSSFKTNFFTSQDILIGNKVVNEAKALLNRAYFTNVVLIKIARAFSELVEKKDNDTGDHINRMVAYSVTLAKAVQKEDNPKYPISDRMILDIERNAALHDIGKISVPDSVLKKDGHFTQTEWEIMKKHPTTGADVFKNLHDSLKIFDESFYKAAEEITRYHHEKWDGSGYPEGLSGFDIPLIARIVAVADVFDAISSKRVYKEAFDFEHSLEIIRNSAKVHLDPFLVEIFLQEKEKIKQIYNQYK